MRTVTLEDIKDLTVAERIQLVEDIWDTVVAESPDLDLTPAQAAELDRRLVLHEKDPHRGRPWAEVKARLLSR